MATGKTFAFQPAKVGHASYQMFLLVHGLCNEVYNTILSKAVSGTFK